MQNDTLYQGVLEIIDRENFEKKLKSGKKLRVKFGIDPTAPDIHLGIAVALRKMAQFQKMGHTIIFLIGDFTATVGDPSGVNKTRPILSDKEVAQNAKTYLEQAGKILDIKKIEVRKNSEWYRSMKLADFLKIKSFFTVQRILERDDFEKRIKEGRDIRCHEIDYPILQAYDSIMLKSDLEIGGTDQKFNMLAGRKLMEKMGMQPQDIMTLQILVGTDGVKKMSKSQGNYIGITDAPKEMYGKIMSIPDSLILDYINLCTDLNQGEIEKIKNPKDQKSRLAFEIVRNYHGEKIAKESEIEFGHIFREKGLPKEIPGVVVKKKSWQILDLLTELRVFSSKSEAKRMINQNGVKVNQKVVNNQFEKVDIGNGAVIQIGKRKFLRVKAGK